ncbi:glycosyltransferase family 4 protein [Azospirillum sp.]|uniref:glycosyltransferase family 4 protein n=1 Tax=Azospirillum sp. TaxID=34012 RepID=UPI003D75C247
MRLCFIDPVEADYNAASPYAEPMGGTQAATCYLAEALAARGHDVHLWNDTSAPGWYRGVSCQNFRRLPGDTSFDFDAVVVNTSADNYMIGRFHKFFSRRSRFLMWCHLSAAQPAGQALADPALASVWDAFVMVSHWQARGYLQEHGLPEERVRVIRNATSPLFETLFAGEPDVFARKTALSGGRITMAYASSATRGLALLQHIFPRVRVRHPEVELAVYCGPQAGRTTEISADPILAPFLGVPGVAHVGSVSQADLAQRLTRTAFLVYPCIVEETACISAMEAMAAGCRVVTHDLGALSETAAGFAALHPPSVDRTSHCANFTDLLCSEIALWKSGRLLPDLLPLQVAYSAANRWSLRAQEWEWLIRSMLDAGGEPVRHRATS